MINLEPSLLCLRGDVTSNWITFNPILTLNEPAIEIFNDGNVKMKIGNGVNNFLDLPYLNEADNVNSDWNSTGGLSEILNKPTTVSGYGLSDVYTINEVDFKILTIQEASNSTNGFMSINDFIKLSGVSSGATKNDTDQNLKNRQNHTGTQLSNTISDFVKSVNDSQLSEIYIDNTDVTSGDTVCSSINKLQTQNSNIKSNLSSHVNNVNNPHGVTKSQIDLGSVDNTSDVNKPISISTQNALNLKVDKTTTITAGSGLTGGGILSGNTTINVGATDDSIVVGENGIKVDTQDILTSTSTTKPLSAKQGKTLQDNKADKTTSIVAGSGLTGGGILSGNTTINVVSLNDGILVNNDNIELKTINDLTTISTTKPLSAAQGKALQDNKAEKTRTITAGNGLTGGGDLSADRTINIANADDSLVVAADSVKVNTNNTLTSTSTTQPLSANQGKVLNEKAVQLETDLNTIEKTIESKYVNIRCGKNLFDKSSSAIISGSYLNNTGNVINGDSASGITPFIPINSGQSIFCNTARATAPYCAVLYDENFIKKTIVPSTNIITASIKGYVRFTIRIDGTYLANTQIEYGTAGTTYESYTPISLGTNGIIDNAITKEKINNYAITSEKIADFSISGPKILEKAISAAKCDFINPGKNLFDKNDSYIIYGSYLNSAGTVVADASSAITPYIKINNGQSLYCNESRNTAPYCAVLYDINFNKMSTHARTLYVTATADGYARFTIRSAQNYLDNTQVENGTEGTIYEPYRLQISNNIMPLPNSVLIKYCHREDGIDTDTDFYGINSIYNCIASITDASIDNKYKIILSDGVWFFTDPLSVSIDTSISGEYSILQGKDYVDIEGQGKDRTIISLKFSPDSVFHSGKTYQDYQPVSWNCNSTLSNISIIGRNCRYSIHLEGGVSVKNNTLNFCNVYFEHEGNVDMGGATVDCIGTGIRDGQTWNFINCDIISQSSCFGLHNALSAVELGGWIKFENCIFDGDSIHLDTYPNEKNLYVKLINPIFRRNMRINYNSYYSVRSVLADYSSIKVNSTSKPIIFNNENSKKGKGLKITSLSTGVTSVVRFSQDSTAFNSIIGISNDTLLRKTEWLSSYQYGYEYRDGGVGLSGFVCGHIDIDSSSSHTSLGKRLGDCSSTNKTLTVIIDGISYDIVFNTNLISATNSQVLALINSVIGSVATASEFCVGNEYYPSFDAVMHMTNNDVSAIKIGYGVIFTGSKTMRIALNSDNRIDGICIDDCAVGQKARVITGGSIYSRYQANINRFYLYDENASSLAVGTELGISATPGVFSTSATPKLMRAFDTNLFNFI